jgi:hypothetical protein
MTDKWTPGPWTAGDPAHDGDNGYIWPISHSTRGIAIARAIPPRSQRERGPNIPESEWRANLALIAAAPELVEALRGLLGASLKIADAASDADYVTLARAEDAARALLDRIVKEANGD